MESCKLGAVSRASASRAALRPACCSLEEDQEDDEEWEEDEEFGGDMYGERVCAHVHARGGLTRRDGSEADDDEESAEKQRRRWRRGWQREGGREQREERTKNKPSIGGGERFCAIKVIGGAGGGKRGVKYQQHVCHNMGKR